MYDALIVKKVYKKMHCKSKIVLLVLCFAQKIVGQCLFTNDKGPQKNVPCVFPFKFNKEIYDSCTNALDPDELFW